MKNAHFLTTAVAAIALSLMLPSGPARAQASIAAVVNGQPITTNEVRERAAFLRLVHKGMGQSELLSTAKEEMVDDKLKVTEAKRMGIEISDADVEKAFGGMAQGMKATPAILMQALKAQGVNPATLKARIKVQMAWQKLVMQRFQKTISITDQQVADALEKQAAAGKGPGVDRAKMAQGTTTEYTLQQITMVVAEPSQQAARAREAETLRGQIKDCQTAVDAVKLHKETVIKSIGKRTADELPEQFRGLLADVPVGKASKPVPSPKAVDLLVVCEKRDIQGDFSVKSKVEGELREEEGKLLARRYLTELKRQAVISYK